MPEYEQYRIPETAEGWRLDKALTLFCPDTGLRHRRRLCDEGSVLVDDRPRKPGYKVRAGQAVMISMSAAIFTHEEMGLYVVKRENGYVAVFKPGGVHSAIVAGKGAPNVEAVLPVMFGDESAMLLNRLDYLTSGILLVALNEEAVKRYHAMEEKGDIQKFYLAEVRGRLDGVATVRAKIDTANRKVSKVLDENDTDERRWTTVEALSHDHGRNTTLVRCLIVKGARHQIRAHLASIKHPIIGDPLYGHAQDGEVLRLHHQQVDLPGFSANAAIEWEGCAF